jgi:glycosyltransferase involved in cell wall biosynthesis
MRVLQAMAGAEHGGAEAFFVRLALALGRAGLDQRIVIRANPARAAQLAAGGIEALQLPFGGRLDFVTPWRLKRVLRDFAPDVVLTWMNRASAMMPEPPPGSAAAKSFVHVGRLGGYYDLKYYRRCRHLIGNTEDIVDYIVKQGWPAERVHYLPNFVAETKAAPARRSEFFTPPDAPLLLAMGRLHPNKGFDVLIEAVARLPDVYLWIAGEGPLRNELEERAHRAFAKPRVRFLGWRDDGPALLAACDVFVCSSRHEPLGNVVIEAWARGVPVIATESQGPAVLVRHGETGILVPVDDALALARAIQGLLADRARARRIGLAGRAAYESRFTEDIVVRRYLDFFRNVAG